MCIYSSVGRKSRPKYEKQLVHLSRSAGQGWHIDRAHHLTEAAYPLLFVSLLGYSQDDRKDSGAKYRDRHDSPPMNGGGYSRRDSDGGGDRDRESDN